MTKRERVTVSPYEASLNAEFTGSVVSQIARQERVNVTAGLTNHRCQQSIQAVLQLPYELSVVSHRLLRLLYNCMFECLFVCVCVRALQMVRGKDDAWIKRLLTVKYCKLWDCCFDEQDGMDCP